MATRTIVVEPQAEAHNVLNYLLESYASTGSAPRVHREAGENRIDIDTGEDPALEAMVEGTIQGMRVHLGSSSGAIMEHIKENFPKYEGSDLQFRNYVLGFLRGVDYQKGALTHVLNETDF